MVNNLVILLFLRLGAPFAQSLFLQKPVRFFAGLLPDEFVFTVLNVFLLGNFTSNIAAFFSAALSCKISMPLIFLKAQTRSAKSAFLFAGLVCHFKQKKRLYIQPIFKYYLCSIKPFSFRLIK